MSDANYGSLPEIGDVIFGTQPIPGSNKPLEPPPPGFETKLTQLEIHFDYVKKQVDRMDADVSTLKSGLSELRTTVNVLAERVSHLPGKGFIVTVVLTGITAAGAIASLVRVLWR